MSVCRCLVTIVIFLAVSACAKTYKATQIETSPFLTDYSLTKEVNDDYVLLSFWKAGVNWSTYKKIIVAPVVIKKAPHSVFNGMAHSDVYQLQEHLEFWMRDALKTQFKFFSNPAEDTLIMQFTLTDKEVSDVLLETFSMLYPPANIMPLLKRITIGKEPLVGKTNIEVKIFDSMTGDLLMVSADVRAGSKTLLDSLDKWGSIENAYKYSATKLSFQLCQRKSRINCQSPSLPKLD